MTPSRGVSGSPAQMPQLRESAASRDWRRASAAALPCGAVLPDCGAVPAWSARRAARVAPAAQADVSVTIAHLLFKISCWSDQVNRSLGPPATVQRPHPSASTSVHIGVPNKKSRELRGLFCVYLTVPLSACRLVPNMLTEKCFDGRIHVA